MAVPAARPRDRDRRRNSKGGHWKMCYSQPDSPFAHRRPRPRAYPPAKCETESYSLRISLWFFANQPARIVPRSGGFNLQAQIQRKNCKGVEKNWLTRIVLLSAK